MQGARGERGLPGNDANVTILKQQEAAEAKEIIVLKSEVKTMVTRDAMKQAIQVLYGNASREVGPRDIIARVSIW